MASSIKNSKAKAYNRVEETFKSKLNEFALKGIAQGYIALAKIIMSRIEQGYTLEEIKSFCENVVEQYKEK